MATRQSVQDKITALEDKGNNTAKEVRDALTEMLDYTENQPFPPTQNVEFFHFWTDDKPVTDKQQNLLFYSIKGIKRQWINFTFGIRISSQGSGTDIAAGAIASNNPNNIYQFPIQDKDLKLIEYLKDIVVLNHPILRFIIPFTIEINGGKRDLPISTSIYFTDKNTICFDFNMNIKDGNIESEIINGTALSSVSFHCPLFKIELV